MSSTKHDDLVVAQYDSQATAYLQSSLHAGGADLERIASLLANSREARALDLGCGGGHLSFLLAAHVRSVLAVDLSAAMLGTVLAEAQRRGLGNIYTQQESAETLDLPGETFDVVATRYSAHHWRHWASGVRTMARLLKPQGLALFSDVIGPADPLLDTWLQSLELLRDPSHVRNASLEAWEQEVAGSGLVVREIIRDRLRLEFASWVARMRTPAVQVSAIRALQQRASSEVKEYFEIAEDGSFSIDTALIIASKADS